MVINRVAPMSVAKLAAVLYALLGLLIGAVISMIAVGGGMVAGRDSGAAVAMIFGAGAIVLLPLCYAVLGFVGALIGAALYNFAAGIIGGVEIDVKS